MSGQEIKDESETNNDEYSIRLPLTVLPPFIIILIFQWLRRKTRRTLPPGPPPIPFLGNLVVVLSESLHLIVRGLRVSYGPISTLYVANRPAVFIQDGSLAHHCLVRKGYVFAHRPAAFGSSRALTANLHSINNAPYGPLWRLLRSRLSSQIFNASYLSDTCSHAQDSVETLLRQLRGGGGVVNPRECFQFAIFRFFALLCFGEKLDDNILKELRQVQLGLLELAVDRFVFGVLPKIFMVVFLNRWKKVLSMRQRQDELFAPFIQSRRGRRCRTNESKHVHEPRAYLDVLLQVKHVEQGGRELSDEEIVNLCSEFLNASTETTSTALEWIMANLVKHQHIQENLFHEIKSINQRRIEVGDIKNMPYLQAVVLEGLRRHPPAYFLLPHTVTEDVCLNKFIIPRGTTINCAIAEIGWDSKTWSNPMEFVPERFLPGGEGEGVDLTGGKEIKMMPFGAGRRVCPGIDIAMILLQYFVANLVSEFKWMNVDDHEVDLSEKSGLIVTMKYQLQASIVQRK